MGKVNSDVVVHRFQENTMEQVRATWGDFKGRRRLAAASLRVYYRDERGKWHLTKKGLALSAEHLDDLAEAGRKLQDNGAGASGIPIGRGKCVRSQRSIDGPPKLPGGP